jgi:polar amino acid transport system permease protein/polar amino acid transport system substrate-binding protein
MTAIGEAFIASLYRNLIAGDAYLVVLRGVGVTLLISVCGLFFGTILGAILCALRMSKIAPLSLSARIAIGAFRGTPVLLLLMLLFYVLFARSSAPAELVAITGFTLNTGAHIAEIMRGALGGLDWRQFEAARMLGFSGPKAFVAVTTPQAVKIALPGYQNAMINLIQWTSVVGFITINDLTRSVNSIGTRTGDPFFALFFGALIYLTLAYAVSGCFVLFSARWARR